MKTIAILALTAAAFVVTSCQQQTESIPATKLIPAVRTTQK